MTLPALHIPESILSATAITCEKILTEQGDGVLSAIRMVDVFFVNQDDPRPPEERPIAINLIVNVKVPDLSEHTIQIALARPDSDPVLIGGAEKTKADSGFPGVPCGLGLTMTIGVIPKVLGTHYFLILVDGSPVARALFTLHPKLAVAKA
jgi:hypothetical protein